MSNLRVRDGSLSAGRGVDAAENIAFGRRVNELDESLNKLHQVVPLRNNE